MNGRELKAKYAQLMIRHNIRPMERAALPLLPATEHPQIISGAAASPAIDAERMSFRAGSLSWSVDPDRIPLRVRHSDQVAGKVISLDYRPDGRLLICARVDHAEARRMAGLSIAATVIESELRSEDSPSGFHFIIHRATIDEISLTPSPANANALVGSRRDVTSFDNTSDAVQAAVIRAQRALEVLHQSWSNPAPAPQPSPRLATRAIRPAPGLILGNVPVALLRRPQTSFSALVAQLPPPGGD